MGILSTCLHCKSASCRWRPEDSFGFPGMEVQVVVSHLTWMLGIKPEFPKIAASILNLRGISLSSDLGFEILDEGGEISVWADFTDPTAL